MDYEKEYNHAFEIAKGYWGGVTDFVRGILESMFPQLAESEDERMRRELLEYAKKHLADFEAHKKSKYKTEQDNLLWRRNVVAYLEKQKEPKPIFRIGDTLKKKGKEYTFTIDKIQGGFYLTKDEHFFPIEEQDNWELIKQSSLPLNLDEAVFAYEESAEYPPANQEEDRMVYDAFKAGAKWQKEQKPELCDMGRWDEESYNNGIHHVLQNPEEYGLTKQKPAECIEDDELLLNAAIYMVEKGNITFAFENNKCKVSDWLKSLPERFNLQPNQEWGDEDEEMLGKLHRLLFICRGEKKFIKEAEYNKLDNWLEALRPQPHWKPSKEQIGALERAIVKIHTTNDIGILAELRDNLKKL